MNYKFQGVFPALLTPFDKNDCVNTKALRQLVSMNIAKGVSGFYVSGSTGEAFLMSDDERKTVYETVANEASGKVALIAQVGTISTKQAMEFARFAEKCGYDAISAVAPFYYKYNFEQVKKHYFSIAESVSIPMIIYNIPTYSGVNLSVEQVGEFFSDEKFVGIKHTSNDYFAMEQFKTNFPDKLVYNGFDEMFLAGLSMGADGGIGSTYNFMAEKFILIQKLFKENKLTAAYEIQKECNRIIKVLCKVGVMEGEKEVLCQMGLDFGHARSPFSILSDEQKAEIKREITDRLN